MVRAIDLKGLPLGEAPFAFKASEREAQASIDLPVEIRNQVARLEIVGERSAGAVQLLDKRWRRRTVGIVSGTDADQSQPLLGASYYLTRALNPFADVRAAGPVAPAEAVTRFLDQHLPMLILADVGNVAEAHDALAKWINDGGVLVRFAGPHLAGLEDDDLIPVRLRRGGRILGGTPELGQAAALGRLLARQPVRRHDRAERRHRAPPGAGGARCAAHRPHLGDAHRRHAAGHRPAPRQGHDRAVPRHRRYPLVGPAAVGLVRRDAQAHRVAGRFERRDTDRHGDGGRRRQCRRARRRRSCRRPACSTASAPSRRRRRTRVRCRRISPATPPPIIRPASTGRRKDWSRSIRLAPADRPAPLDFAGLNANFDVYRHGEPLDLRGPVFVAGLVLLMLDGLLVFWLSGGFGALLPRRRATAALLALGVAVAMGLPHPTHAQTPAKPAPTLTAEQEAFALKATHKTHLAYIVTGDPEVDEVTQAPACRASRCSWRSAPRSNPAIRWASIRRATSSPSSR